MDRVDDNGVGVRTVRIEERLLVQRELETATTIALGSFVLAMFATVLASVANASAFACALTAGLTALGLWPLASVVKWGVVVCMNWMEGLLTRSIVFMTVAVASALAGYWTTSMFLAAVEGAVEWVG